MLRIFNLKAVSQNERFFKAFLIGLLSAIVLAITYGFITRLIGIQISLLYIIIGYLIAYTIKKFGKGVQIKFSYLGAILTFFAILFGDIIAIFGFIVFIDFEVFVSATITILRYWLLTEIGSLLSLLFRLFAIYFAFSNSRIV